MDRANLALLSSWMTEYNTPEWSFVKAERLSQRCTTYEAKFFIKIKDGLEISIPKKILYDGTTEEDFEHFYRNSDTD